MSLRFHASALAAFGVTLLLAPANGAEPAAKDAGKAPKSWTQPRTPDGQPDLQGYWTNGTYIPLERPKELAGKEFYTEAEAAAFEKKRVQDEHSQAADDVHYDNVIWQGDKWAKGAMSLRTSIVFDPPDGHLPPLSPRRTEARRGNGSCWRAIAMPPSARKAGPWASAASLGAPTGLPCSVPPITPISRSCRASIRL